MGILIVDDSKHLRLLLENMLKRAGYDNIYSAGSANEAYQILQVDNPSISPPEIKLIIMDINMPTEDGIVACRRIKAEEHLKDIPIIVLTAITDEKKLKSAMEAGAVGYLQKPARKELFLAKIKSIVG